VPTACADMTMLACGLCAVQILDQIQADVGARKLEARKAKKRTPVPA
jgi:hypothetical protein